MSWRTTVLIHAALAATVFFMVRFVPRDPPSRQPGGEEYNEECQSEGCESEEVRELWVTYNEECNSEGCSFEEVAETAGGHGSINAMLNDFQSRGWAVNQCTFFPFSPPGGLNNAGSGDSEIFAAAGSWCNQPTIDRYWNDFDFDKVDWDEGFGWDDACNINRPLARTFNAIHLLALFGRSKPADSNNWLPWFYAFASASFDELDGVCGTGTFGGTLASTTFGPIIDNYTELYFGFFYGQNVPSRTATLVHEAQHADDWSTHAGSSCAWGSCDDGWSDWEARTYEVMYLWWLRAANGGSITTLMSNLAQTQANLVLANAFDARPTNRDVFGSGATSPSAPFSVP